MEKEKIIELVVSILTNWGEYEDFYYQMEDEGHDPVAIGFPIPDEDDDEDNINTE